MDLYGSKLYVTDISPHVDDFINDHQHLKVVTDIMVSNICQQHRCRYDVNEKIMLTLFVRNHSILFHKYF